MDEEESPETRELGIREAVKADYTERQKTDPIGETFRAVGNGAHNLVNVGSVRERYPEEYAARMQKSAIRPQVEEGRWLDSGWFTQTWAGTVLKGVFDADDVDYVKRHLGEDMLGIPPEFLQLPEVQKYMRVLVRRPWASRDVGDYLQRIFNIQGLSEQDIPTDQVEIDKTPFR